MPKEERFRLNKDCISKIKMVSASNKVLVKVLLKAEDDKTDGGIYKIAFQEKDWDLASHTNRWGQVMALPDRLTYLPTRDHGMPWDTEMELEVGMLVWVDYLSVLNGVIIVDEDDTEYIVIDYQNCYCAVAEPSHDKGQLNKDKSGKVIPLNGYHIFERVHTKPKTVADIYLEERVDTRYGIVKYPAVPNKGYEGKGQFDIELEVGDKCLFSVPYEVLLEDKAHAKFDGGSIYRRAQSKDVMVVWRGEDLIINKDIVLVSTRDMVRERPSGLLLINQEEMYSMGEVFMSGSDEIQAKDLILYGKDQGIPITYKDVEYRVLMKREIIGIK